MERAIETQRLRLLRWVAGLFVAVGFLSVAAVSRGFSDWVCGYVGSVLSRAELAARYLVIAQARVLGARRGYSVTNALLSEAFAQTGQPCETDASLSDCRARLRALQAMLANLPRHALRLLRRIEDQIFGRASPGALSSLDGEKVSASLRGWRGMGQRIERPPDCLSHSPHF